MRLRDRPTAEVLLLLLGATVCTAIVFAGAAISAIAILRPAYPIGPVTEALVTALQNILFTVLGVAAGRYIGSDAITSAPARVPSTRPEPAGTVPPDTDTTIESEPTL